MKPAPPVTRTRSPIGRRIWAATILAALAATLGSCGGGGQPQSQTRRAAEPADAPPTRERPAGRVAEVGNEPEGLVFDPASAQLALALRDPDLLAFVDPRTLEVTRRLALPATARHLAYSPRERAVVVPAEAANEVLFVSAQAGVQARVAVGRHPHDAAVVRGATFVADEHSDQVSVLRDHRVVATLPSPHQPGGIAAAGPYVALVAVSARVLQLYDAAGPRELGRTTAGVGPSHVVADGPRVYVADTQGDAIEEYETGVRPRRLGRVAAPGTPYGLAIDLERHRLWVTATATNRLLEYEISASKPPRLLAAYPTVRQPNSVAVDPHSGDVFVAGRTPHGTLERISPRKDRR